MAITGTGRPSEPITYEASGGVTKYRFLAYAGAGTTSDAQAYAQATVQGQRCDGASLFTALTTETSTMYKSGAPLVECGAAVTTGAAVMTDVNGRFITQTAGNAVVGYLEGYTTTAAGEIRAIRLVIHADAIP